MPTLSRVGAWLACVLLYAASAGAQELTESQLVDLIVRDGAQARAIRLGADVVRHVASHIGCESTLACLPGSLAAYSQTPAFIRG